MDFKLSNAGKYRYLLFFTLVMVAFLELIQYTTLQPVGNLNEVEKQWFLASLWVFFGIEVFMCSSTLLVRTYFTNFCILFFASFCPFLIQMIVSDNLSIIVIVYALVLIPAGFTGNKMCALFILLNCVILFLSRNYLIYSKSLISPSLGTILDVNQSIAGVLLFICISSVSLFSAVYGNRIHAVQQLYEHEKMTNKQLIQFNMELQSFAKETEENSAITERRKITREMHDSNGYTFTNIISLMNAAISSENQGWPEIENILQMTLEQAQKGLQESRKTLRTIRKQYENRGDKTLHNEVFEISKIFKSCTSVDVLINYGNLKQSYSPEIDKTICRILQESLVNSIRHGKATEINISFWESKDEIGLTIEDNGCGCKVVNNGIGLSGMEERVFAFGGSIEYNGLDGGFKVKVSLPIGELQTK